MVGSKNEEINEGRLEDLKERIVKFLDRQLYNIETMKSSNEILEKPETEQRKLLEGMPANKFYDLYSALEEWIVNPNRKSGLSQAEQERLKKLRDLKLLFREEMRRRGINAAMTADFSDLNAFLKLTSEPERINVLLPISYEVLVQWEREVRRRIENARSVLRGPTLTEYVNNLQGALSQIQSNMISKKPPTVTGNRPEISLESQSEVLQYIAGRLETHHITKGGVLEWIGIKIEDEQAKAWAFNYLRTLIRGRSLPYGLDTHQDPKVIRLTRTHVDEKIAFSEDDLSELRQLVRMELFMVGQQIKPRKSNPPNAAMTVIQIDKVAIPSRRQPHGKRIIGATATVDDGTVITMYGNSQAVPKEIDPIIRNLNIVSDRNIKDGKIIIRKVFLDHRGTRLEMQYFAGKTQCILIKPNGKPVLLVLFPEYLMIEDPKEVLTDMFTAYLEHLHNKLTSRSKDKAQIGKTESSVNGGIDLNTAGMNWKISKDSKGVEINIDSAMIERVRREGIDSLSPVIFRITPVTSIWPLVGLQAPAQEV